MEDASLAPLQQEGRSWLRDEMVRSGVERLLAQALEVEAELHISRHRDDRDERGKRLVVRNGYLPTREIQCGAGLIGVHQPRVHDARVDAHGRRQRYTSTVLPAYARQASCIVRPSDEGYFHGLAAGDFSNVFRETFGSIVDELPRSFVPRLAELWDADRERMSRRTFHGQSYTQFWADEVPYSVDGDVGGGVLILAAKSVEGIDVLEAQLGRPGSPIAWGDLFMRLAGRGLSVRTEFLQGEPPVGASRAAEAHAQRRGA